MMHNSSTLDGELAALVGGGSTSSTSDGGGSSGGGGGGGDGHLMALYSVVNKGNSKNEGGGGHNYEDTESEYAVELRRQAYLQTIGEGKIGFAVRSRKAFFDFIYSGEHGGYGNIGGQSATGSTGGGAATPAVSATAASSTPAPAPPPAMPTMSPPRHGAVATPTPVSAAMVAPAVANGMPTPMAPMAPMAAATEAQVRKNRI